jgi:hypothetical protein
MAMGQQKLFVEVYRKVQPVKAAAAAPAKAVPAKEKTAAPA